MSEAISTTVTLGVTSADQSRLLQVRAQALERAEPANQKADIVIDPERCYQTMDGFGFSLTGGSALLISRLPTATRQALLRELFLSDGIGVSFLRLSIGASDLSERSFSYLDLPDGQADFDLQQFDLWAGDREVVPLLREILAINPTLKLIATPWSAPRWMKTNQAWVGGSLRDDCQAVYARYFARYLLAMREQGIVIDAITPQNEPQNHKNDPSMLMSAEQQAGFVKHHLGPALHDSGLGEVEILCWDHNCDAPEYPLSVLADEEARRYLSGSAWHLYGGDIAVLSRVHQEYPALKLYFTEQWVGSDGQFGGDLLWHIRHVLIGACRNWSSAVLEWNLASDPDCCPHTPGGEARCVGALTIDGDQVSRNVAYYIIGHAAKWVRPGSRRLHSNDEVLANVAFLTPENQLVLIVLNDSEQDKPVAILCQGHAFTLTAPAYSVTTCCWAWRE